ncbi:MAG: HAMP domain-containing protein [Acidobacteria bacterium]|nr:HAMP domain-containing protein [Acidobacteriota bacterium]
MSVSLRPSSVRVRMTLWYTGALAFVLVAYAALVFVFVRHALYRDLDHRLHEDIDLVQEELEVTDDGRLVWRGSGHPDEAEESTTVGGRWLEVWSREGALLLRSATGDPLGLPAPQPAAEPRPVTLSGGERRLRVAAALREVAGVPVLVRAARSEEGVRRELGELLVVQGIGLPVALALAAFGGYHLARRALGPVARMAARARGITAERLGERLAVENPADELGQLAATLNETFARIERSVEQLRRFTADASHELRTPLTALRSVGEVGLEERPDDKLFGDVVGSMLEEVDGLTRLVDTLLALSRADAGQVRLAREPVDLAALARSAVQHLEDLSNDKEQQVRVEAPDPDPVLGDWPVLRQAVINVLDNAIKYSPPRTTIDVAVGGTALWAWIEVSDNGSGIAPEDRDRIFERFYRVDKARSREQGGTGLGLALAKWGVESHGGRIELRSEVGRGSTFRIVLPAGSGAPAGSPALPRGDDAAPEREEP